MSRVTAIFSACPHIGRTLEMLGPFVSSKESAPYHCPTSTNPVDISAILREHLMGASVAIIGIGGSCEHIVTAGRTLQFAAKSHLCAMVVTENGWKFFSEWLLTLPPTELKVMTHRTVAAVLVGKNQANGFVGFGCIFSDTKVHEITGLHWADTTCKLIAGHILGATIRGAA